MIYIAKKITDEERLRSYDKLQLTEQEKAELLAYDKAVEQNERTEFDLSPEQQKNAKKYTTTGTRKVPTTYQFKPKKRKEDTVKKDLIAALADFLRTADLGIENLEIVNDQKLLEFTIEGKNFRLDLARNLKKDKAQKGGDSTQKKNGYMQDIIQIPKGIIFLKSVLQMTYKEEEQSITAIIASRHNTAYLRKVLLNMTLL